MSELDRLSAALADCLEALERGESPLEEILARYPADAEELRELLGLAERLEPLGELTPRRAFAEGATEQLMARLGERRAPWWAWLGRLGQTRLPVLRWRTGAALSGLGILLVLMLLGGGVWYTAAAAGPGDALYGLNLRLEQAHLRLVRNPEAAARIHLDLAGKRLRETELRLDGGELGRALAALDAFEKEIGSVADLVRKAEGVEHDILLGLLSDARLTHLEVLDSLLARAPEGARGALEHAIDLVVLYEGRPAETPGADRPAEEPAEEAGRPTVIPVPTEVVIPTAKPTRPAEPPAPTEVAPTIRPGPPTALPVPTQVVVPTIPPGPPITLPVPPNIPAPPDGRP